MKVTLAQLDNPLVFLFNLSLALIPIMVLVFWGAAKAGLFSPSPR